MACWFKKKSKKLNTLHFNKNGQQNIQKTHGNEQPKWHTSALEWERCKLKSRCYIPPSSGDMQSNNRCEDEEHHITHLSAGQRATQLLRKTQKSNSHWSGDQGQHNMFPHKTYTWILSAFLLIGNPKLELAMMVQCEDLRVWQPEPTQWKGEQHTQVIFHLYTHRLLHNKEKCKFF